MDECYLTIWQKSTTWVLLNSYFLTAFPMPLVWTHACFRGGKVGGYKLIFRVCMACTNSADIYILWWIVKNKWNSSGWEPQECWKFYIYIWLLTLPLLWSPPTPVYCWPACHPKSTSQQLRLRAPRCVLWERPECPTVPTAWCDVRAHCCKVMGCMILF